MTQDQAIEVIAALLASIGAELHHFPEDREEGMRELWQYDEADPSGVGVVVQVFKYQSAASQPALDVVVSHEGGSWSFAAHATEWEHAEWQQDFVVAAKGGSPF